MPALLLASCGVDPLPPPSVPLNGCLGFAWGEDDAKALDRFGAASKVPFLAAFPQTEGGTTLVDPMARELQALLAADPSLEWKIWLDQEWEGAPATLALLFQDGRLVKGFAKVDRLEDTAPGLRTRLVQRFNKRYGPTTHPQGHASWRGVGGRVALEGVRARNLVETGDFSTHLVGSLFIAWEDEAFLVLQNQVVTGKRSNS